MFDRSLTALSVACVALGGCASVDWPRTVYAGWRNAEKLCRLNRDPAAPPCSDLPNYEQYQKERARVMRPTAPDAPAPVDTAPR